MKPLNQNKMKDEEPKQESHKEPTMIDDWLNEYGDPEIYKKVERELESREAADKSCLVKFIDKRRF